MSTDTLLYLEVHVIDTILVGLMLMSQRHALGTQLDQQRFRVMCISVLLVSLVDGLGQVINGIPAGWAIAVNNLCNASYYSLTAITALLWLSYVELKLDYPREKQRKHFLLLLIPTLLTVLAAFLSPITGWMFTVRPDGMFARGSLYLLQAGCSYVCMSIATLEAIYAACHSTGALRRDAVYLSCFVVLPVLASITQTLCFGLPVTWPAVTLSMMMIFLNVQNRQISLDALTGINNRGHMDRYLAAQVKDDHAVGRLRMVLIDVDDFKHINDTYGHAMGDQALVRVTNVLKHVCSLEHHRGDFLARYGGDEFVLLVQRDGDDEVRQMLQTIHGEMEQTNQRGGFPCAITLSIGYATLRHEARSAEQLITEADRRMYEAKRARRSVR